MLTKTQVQQNIEALEKQGASQNDIQGYLNTLKGKIAPDASAPTPAPADTTGFWGKAANVAKKVGGFLIQNEQNFGQDIGDAIYAPFAANQIQDEAIQNVNQMNQLLNQRKALKAAGKDTTHIDAAIKSINDNHPDYMEQLGNIVPSIKKSNKQILGDAAGVATDIAAFGTYGNAAKGAQTGKLLVSGPVSSAVGDVLGKAGIGTSAFEKTVPTAATKLAAFGKGALEGVKQAVPIGLAYGAASSAQADDPLPTMVKKALISGTVSGVIGGALSGVANLRNVNPDTLDQEAVASYKKGLAATKEKYKDEADKVIPDLLDQKVWGTKKQLVEKAEQGIKLSADEYGKLGELQGTVSTNGLVQSIDDEIANYSRGGRAFTEKMDAVDSAIANHLQSADQILNEPDMADKVAKAGGIETILDDAKNNIVAQLRHDGINDAADVIEKTDTAGAGSIGDFMNTLKQSVADGLEPKPVSVNSAKISQLQKLKDDVESLQLYNKPGEAYQQDLRELAQDYGNVVYETRKSLKTVEDNSTLSQVRKIDTAIRDLLNTNNPDYAKINEVYTMNSRLFDILDETARRKEARPLISWFNAIVGSGGATAGATAGGFIAGPAGSTVGSLGMGTLAVGLTTALNSTWYNTLRAVQKANLADKLTEIGSLTAAKYWVQILNAQGVKGVNQLLSTPKEQLDQAPQ